MAKIQILVGTVYGNALDVAEMCMQKLVEKGHQVELLRQPDINDIPENEVDTLLVCTSTTGQGEIPDNLLQLYCQLQEQLPLMPHARYGLITLGDSSYDTFAEAGALMETLLQELQLKRVGPALVIDACETMAPCEEAEPWVLSWSDLLIESA